MTMKVTERERQIMRLAGKGLTEREIGRRLGVSFNTVKVIKARCRKRNGKSTAEICAWVALDDLRIEHHRD